MILWILAVVIAIVGVVQLLQGQILFALLLFVVAALVGPGGYSTTDTQSTEAAVPLGAKATATAGRVDRNPTAKAIGRLGLVAVVYCIVAGAGRASRIGEFERADKSGALETIVRQPSGRGVSHLTAPAADPIERDRIDAADSRLWTATVVDAQRGHEAMREIATPEPSIEAEPDLGLGW